MGTTPRRFILQALDPDHGSPVMETLFLVDNIDDLRRLLGSPADGDPDLEAGYDLDPASVAAISERFGTTFDPGGRETHLRAWHSTRDCPYLIHTGYELPLLLEGRKHFAYFRDAYPPHSHFDEDRFDRYVAQGLLHKEVELEPFEKSTTLENGQVIEGTRTAYYTRPGEEWRIRASKLIWAAASRSGWNEDFERMEGMLFGYEDWQNDWWIEQLRKRGRVFGAIAVYRTVGTAELSWIQAAGWRALPPAESAAVEVCTGEYPDDQIASRLMDCSTAVALIRLNIASRFFLDLVNGQAGPTYVIPSEQIPGLNRNLVGAIEVVMRCGPHRDPVE
jgi:hypothetical protein